MFEKEKNQSGRYLLALVFASVFLFSVGILSHNAFADTVVATIPVMGSDIAVNPVTNMIYVDEIGPHVFIINGSTNSVVSTITYQSNPAFGAGIDVNRITNMIYVAASKFGSVIVINGTSNSLASTIHVGTGPVGVSVNPNTNMIYVANSGFGFNTHPYQPGTVSVIDGLTNSVISTISVGNDPQGIAVNPNTNKIYVANQHDSTVSVINGSTNTIVSTIPVGSSPTYVAANPNTNMIYVANTGSNSLSVIDGSTDNVISTIQVGSKPVGIGVNPNTSKIYVANLDGSSVSIIDGMTNTIESTLTVGSGPQGISVNPSTNMIYVTHLQVSSISVIQGSQTTTSQLQVNSQDNNGNPITGFYTELYASNGTQIGAGYTPFSFTLNNADTYTVHVENFGKFMFSHWLDTGSTDANRTISITTNESITAVYKTVPQPPTGLNATAVSSSQINLNWNAPTNDGGSSVTSYEIKRSTDGSTWLVLVKNTGTTDTTYSDTGLSPNTTYYYRVFAINDVGTSLRSNTASATTPLLSVAGVTVGPTSTTLP